MRVIILAEDGFTVDFRFLRFPRRKLMAHLSKKPTQHIQFISCLFVYLFADLSECQLVQVPDAVYHLMRHTELKTCDLSSNVIKKIPAKFSVKFNLLTGKRTLRHCLAPDASPIKLIIVQALGLNFPYFFTFQN